MNRKGFTLIELLIVVVIIGILAAIAIPKFANTKAKAYIASMKSDLRNLVTAEEAYFADSVKYSNTHSCTVPPTAGTVNFCVTVGNTLGGPTVNGGGWSATITNVNLTNPTVTCAIFVNTTAQTPATTEGAPACQ
ncbi:MAG: pilin [Gemmatimonadetes bacterium]|nr:MAG: pilin [Gemmatimonadota bacterium]PYP38686.1 MAG: pilin [Gemmatimonadota bacterium]